MTPEQIGRALAAADPNRDNDNLSFGATCFFCEASPDDNGDLAPAGHEPDCPWRLAVEWVAVSDTETSHEPKASFEWMPCGSSVVEGHCENCDVAVGDSCPPCGVLTDETIS